MHLNKPYQLLDSNKGRQHRKYASKLPSSIFTIVAKGTTEGWLFLAAVVLLALVMGSLEGWLFLAAAAAGVRLCVLCSAAKHVSAHPRSSVHLIESNKERQHRNVSSVVRFK